MGTKKKKENFIVCSIGQLVLFVHLFLCVCVYFVVRVTRVLERDVFFLWGEVCNPFLCAVNQCSYLAVGKDWKFRKRGV